MQILQQFFLPLWCNMSKIHGISRTFTKSEPRIHKLDRGLEISLKADQLELWIDPPWNASAGNMIFSNLSMISKYRLKITLNTESWMPLVCHMLRIDYSTMPNNSCSLFIGQSFRIMKIEVFKMYFCKKKITFLFGFGIAFGAQVAVLRSWRVVGAPPRPSARPASGRRRPSGTAARAAPPWRRAAAPRRLRQKCRCLWKGPKAQTKNLQISF